MNNRTFTKIRKWAEDNGYEVKERVGQFTGRVTLEVIVSDEQRFEMEMRESTIYQSIRGQRGNCAGLYLTENLKPKNGKYMRPYSFHQRTQKDAIESMERDIKRWSNEGRYYHE